LRVRYSNMLGRAVLRNAKATYQAEKGSPPEDAWLEPPPADVASLWRLRRDLLGVRPTKPLLTNSPASIGALVGLILLMLRAKGANFRDSYWELGQERIRVIHTPNEFVHNAEINFAGDEPPMGGATVVVCEGAERSNLPPDVARVDQEPSVARAGTHAKWLTRAQAIKELDL
jgi:hypothetical protein